MKPLWVREMGAGEGARAPASLCAEPWACARGRA